MSATLILWKGKSIGLWGINSEPCAEGGETPMSSQRMVNFIYQDFYDFARLIAVMLESRIFILDSVFDSDKDDYDKFYDVFEVAAAELPAVNSSWDGLRSGAQTYLGRVSVRDVVFDPSRRKLIDIEGVLANLEN